MLPGAPLVGLGSPSGLVLTLLPLVADCAERDRRGEAADGEEEEGGRSEAETGGGGEESCEGGEETSTIFEGSLVSLTSSSTQTFSTFPVEDAVVSNHDGGSKSPCRNQSGQRQDCSRPRQPGFQTRGRRRSVRF